MITIENNIPDPQIADKGSRRSKYRHFLTIVRDIKPGQSFVMDKVPSHYKNILGASPILLKKGFRSYKEGDKVRICCLG